MCFLIVTIHPHGPLSLPTNIQMNITCFGGQLTSLYVLFGDKDAVLYYLAQGSEFVPGIKITHLNQTSVFILVNTSNTSVTGLRCEGNIVIGGKKTIIDSDTLDLTIYGKG